MRMNLSYWVFTSGEQGIHGLDWGIKFASESFTDKYALDVEYREALKNFSLNPSLKRPNESGLLVLPFRDSEYIAGFIFPGTDHGGRLNTSSVVALIPREITRRMTAGELFGRIWCANDIPGIARKNSDSRPDFLTLGENLTENFTAYGENLRWPGRNEGYISADGDLESLERVNESANDSVAEESHSKSKTGLIIAGVAVMAVIAGGVFMFSESDKPPEINQPSQNQNAESQTLITSQDSRKQIAESKPKESKPNEPEKNIMDGIISRLESFEGTKDFMSSKSLVSFDISASRRSLPEALIDRDGIIKAAKNLLGDIEPQKTPEGFMLKPDKKKLPIETWRKKKAEIFTVITPENLKPSQSLHHDRMINALRSSESKEGWLTLYFMTERENVRLAAFVNLSGNGSPSLRLAGESSGLIPTAKSVNMAAKISERETAGGYRIIFDVSGEGLNDFDSSISEFVTQFAREID